MNYGRGRATRLGIAACVTISIFLSGMSAVADVAGTIVQKGNATPLTGQIRWLPATKKYVITTTDRMTVTLLPSQVSKVTVQEPAEYKGLVQMVKSGQFAAAIPGFEKLISDYAMLQWDVEAAPYLADSYFRTGKAAKAIELCDKIAEDNPSATASGPLFLVYCEALLQTQKSDKLKKVLDKAEEKGKELGDRKLLARVQLKRGDVLKAGNMLKDALTEGYLRVIALYQDVKEIQPEALYKACKSFEELSQLGNAERMRRKLLAEYPQDPFAERLKAGN